MYYVCVSNLLALLVKVKFIIKGKGFDQTKRVANKKKNNFFLS